MKSSLEKIFINIAIGALGFYKAHISCHLMSACRFHPTCSEYAVESLKNNTPKVALRMILSRLSKCHPFYQHREALK